MKSSLGQGILYLIFIQIFFFFNKRQQPYLGFNLTLLLEKKIFLLWNIFKKLGKIGKVS